MSFFFFLIFFFFLFIVIIISLSFTFVKVLFGGIFKRRRKADSNYNRWYNDRSGYSSGNTSHHEKVFSKEEGEYVDFEEIE